MMDEPTMGAPNTRKAWWKIAGVTLLVLALLALAVGLGIPVWLNSASGRGYLLTQANRVLAPARLEVRAFHWSWFGPTRMEGFVLRDHEGEAVVDSPEAIWDRTLWQAVADRPRLGTLRLPGANLDIEKARDDSIDLVEALKPILSSDPRTSLAIRIERGTLKITSRELAEPIEGRDVDLSLDRPQNPKPTTWRLRMSGTERSPDAHIEISGNLDRSNPQPTDAADLATDMTFKQWPLAVALGVPGSHGKGLLDGSIHAARTAGGWATAGSLELRAADFTSPALPDEHVALGNFLATWTIRHADGGPVIEQAKLKGSGLDINASGRFPTAPGARLEAHGRLDLVELTRRLPKTLHLRDGLALNRGEVELHAIASSTESGATWEIRGGVASLEGALGEKRLRIDQPATVQIKAQQNAQGLALEQFLIESSAINAKGEGDFTRGINLAGTIDLAAFGRQFHDFLEFPGEGLSGNGSFSAHYKVAAPQYTATWTADLNNLRLGISKDVPAPPTPSGNDAPARLTHVEASINGPSGEAGWPTGWSDAAAKVDGSGIQAQLAASSGPRGLSSFRVDAQTTVDGARRPVEIQLHAAGEQKDAAFLVSQARLELATVPDPFGVRPMASVALDATGSYDRETDTLTLTPEPLNGDRPTSLRLAEEGLTIKGLRAGTWTAEGGLAGDFVGLETLASALTDVTPLGLDGSWHAHGSLTSDDTSRRFRADLSSSDLALGTSEQQKKIGPLTARVDVSQPLDTDRLDVSQLEVHSAWGTLQTTGSLANDSGARTIHASGSVDPAWDDLNRLLQERVEPNATIDGGSLVFEINGALQDDLLAGLDIVASLDLSGVDIYGMKLEATPLAVQARHGQIEFASIQSTLNGGTIVLNPELSQRSDGTWVAALGKGSFIESAEVNEQVSHRVLAYVAPVLDGATRMSGQVSASFDKAEFPLTSDAREKAVVEGAVVFHDVAFAPGPMAARLYETVGIPPVTITLNEPVVLLVADGRVHQRGFSMPLTKLARVEMNGSVGFDRSVDLVVNVPLAAERFANVPVVNAIAPALRLTFPIRGTLDEPRVDGEAMAKSMGEMGLDVARSAGLGGIESLVRGLSTPRDPEEEARLQAEREERRNARQEQQALKKAQRQQKRDERRLRRSGGS